MAADALWPNQRLYDANVIEASWCDMCTRLAEQPEEDTCFHRLWKCKHPEVAAKRIKIASHALINEAAAASVLDYKAE